MAKAAAPYKTEDGYRGLSSLRQPHRRHISRISPVDFYWLSKKSLLLSPRKEILFLALTDVPRIEAIEGVTTFPR